MVESVDLVDILDKAVDVPGRLQGVKLDLFGQALFEEHIHEKVRVAAVSFGVLVAVAEVDLNVHMVPSLDEIVA